jgi:hypothetical protein
MAMLNNQRVIISNWTFQCQLLRHLSARECFHRLPEVKKALEYEDKDDGAFWMLGAQFWPSILRSGLMGNEVVEDLTTTLQPPILNGFWKVILPLKHGNHR